MKEPTLFLMFGYPGAGKTTTAEVVQQLTGAEHLSSDRLRAEMFPKSDFSQDEHDRLYETLDQNTKQLLEQGKDVIYDANLNRYGHRKDKYDICRQTGAKAILLWVQTPKPLAKERAGHYSRQHLWPVDETPSQLFDRIADVIEEPTASEPYIAIDGTKVDQDYIRQKLQDAHVL